MYNTEELRANTNQYALHFFGNFYTIHWYKDTLLYFSIRSLNVKTVHTSGLCALLRNAPLHSPFSRVFSGMLRNALLHGPFS